MTIFCVSCHADINCQLVTGSDVYPHRKDLKNLKFWQCPECKNFVGCHKNNKNNIPLGIIATPEIKKARMHIHKLIDPLWKEGLVKRKSLYEMISKEVGWNYHTSLIRSMGEARIVYKACQKVGKKITEKKSLVEHNNRGDL